MATFRIRDLVVSLDTALCNATLPAPGNAAVPCLGSPMPPSVDAFVLCRNSLAPIRICTHSDLSVLKTQMDEALVLIERELKDAPKGAAEWPPAPTAPDDLKTIERKLTEALGEIRKKRGPVRKSATSSPKKKTASASRKKLASAGRKKASGPQKKGTKGKKAAGSKR